MGDQHPPHDEKVEAEPGEEPGEGAATNGDSPVAAHVELDPFDETRATVLAPAGQAGGRSRSSRQLKVHLVIARQDEAPVKVDMVGDTLWLGRDPVSCDVVLAGHLVSRRHARIERDDRGYFTLSDCRSSNGTLVDGRRIDRMNLINGDRFQIGDHDIEFVATD